MTSRLRALNTRAQFLTAKLAEAVEQAKTDELRWFQVKELARALAWTADELATNSLACMAADQGERPLEGVFHGEAGLGCHGAGSKRGSGLDEAR